MSANRGNDSKLRDVILDELERGIITASEANVKMVRGERVRVVTKLPASVRKDLNDAVKAGKLCHMKKDGLKPEVYYHPNFEHLACQKRNDVAQNGISALRKIYAA